MSTEVSQRLRRQVAERAYHVCEYCLVHADDTLWGCEIDHIISRKHGGRTEASNLALACVCCNAAKGSDIATVVGEPPQLSRLFHPRTDRWAESFHLVGSEIDPANDIGTATVKLLRLNAPYRLAERELLAGSGRYPTIEALARMNE